MTTQFPIKWNKYILLDELDSGGMADLFLGVYDQDKAQHSRLMVIKRIRESHKDVAEWMAMFKNEIQLLLCLQSPHIVQTFDFSIDGTEPFIVMEYIEGITLWQIFNEMQVTGKTLSEAVCVEIFKQVAAGLRDAHNFVDPSTNIKKPIVHKDISPHNILVGSNGLVKVIDFGIAKSSISDYKTLITQIKGKPSYMSPEQINGDKDLDFRSDMFSMGVCFWELLTGKRLFPTDGDPFLNIYKKFESSNFKVQDVRELRPTLSIEISSILSTLLEKDKKNRFSSMDEFIKRLQKYQAEQALATGYDLVKECVNDNFKSYLNQQKDKAQESLKKYKSNNILFNDPDTESTIVSSIYSKKIKTIFKWVAVSSVCLAIIGLGYLAFSVSSKPSEQTRQGTMSGAQRRPGSTTGDVNKRSILSDEERTLLREVYSLKKQIETNSSESVKSVLSEIFDSTNKRQRMENFLNKSKDERVALVTKALAAFKEISALKDEHSVIVKIQANKELMIVLPPPRSKMPQNGRSAASE